MRRNSFRIALLTASLLMTFLACSSYAAKRSSSGGDGSPITVVIDAGHGGYDRGGIPGQRVSEKDMTLDVARRLKSVLAASGYRVVMTRDSDVFVPLGTRCAIANSYRNAIFVSVHFNSATRRGASGIETYFYSRDSLSLASAIHHYVAGGAPSENRGVRRRGYFVLRRTNMPAYSSSAVFSLTRPKLRTLRMLLIVKNLPKRLQPESADAIPLPAPVVRPESRRPKAFRCNRTSTKPGSPNPKRAGRSGRPRKALDERRRLHRNRPR